QMAAAHVQYMQKALPQMNLQIHHVLSDITGRSGLAILDAILAGERTPAVLTQWRHPQVQASAEVVMKSRVGDYRREHLFTLRQSLEAYRYYQDLITRCDQEMEEQWQNFDRQLPPDAPALPPEAYPHARRKNQFRFAMRSERYRIFGVDLTAIPSLNALTAYTLLAEVGTDGSKFRNIHAFASWGCFCPHNNEERRKSSFRQNPQECQSRQSRPAASGPDPGKEYFLSGHLLSQEVRPFVKACWDHGYRPQTGTHHFSHGYHRTSL